MAAPEVRWVPDRGGQASLMQSPGGAYGAYLTRLGNRMVNSAKGKAPVDTGLMRSRIEFRLELQGKRLGGVLAAKTAYAYWVHDGTRWREGRPFLLDAVRETIG